jgi:ubiquinone/menaquinone biosynthesis C-methylase UbiE
MEPQKEINKDYWDYEATKWSILVPIERPSVGEIKIYEDYLQKVIHKCKGKCKAIIYGATPELRDLLAKYEVDVTLVDINPNMVKAMEQLLEYSDGNEKVIISNWTEIPLKDGQYDVILCDHGLVHVPFEIWPKFFSEMARLLKKGGFMINSMVTVPRNQIISMEEFIGMYKRGNIFSMEDKFFALFRASLGLDDIKEGKYLKDMDDYNKKLKEYVEKGEITEKDFSFLENPWKAKAVLPPKEAVDQESNKYFQIKSIRTNLEHPVFTCHKIYFGQVRK